jgi:hypothetical protein
MAVVKGALKILDGSAPCAIHLRLFEAAQDLPTYRRRGRRRELVELLGFTTYP